MIDRQDDLVIARVFLAFGAALDLDVAQERECVLDALDARPLPGGMGAAHIGVEYHLQPPGRPKLHVLQLAGQRITFHRLAPPAKPFQLRLQARGELRQRLPAGQRVVEFGADRLQHLLAHGLGHDKAARVLIAPHVAKVEPRVRRCKALLTEERDGVFGLNGAQFYLHGRRAPGRRPTPGAVS